MHLDFSLKFYGCVVHDPPVTTPTDCSPDPSVHASALDASYRHFAVDDANDIPYFCDQNPHAHERGLYCHAFVADPVTGVKHWRGKLTYT